MTKNCSSHSIHAKKVVVVFVGEGRHSTIFKIDTWWCGSARYSMPSTPLLGVEVLIVEAGTRLLEV